MGSLQDALLKTGLADERPKSERKPGGKKRGKAGDGLRGLEKGRRVSPESERKPGKKGKTGRGGSVNPPASDLERAWMARRKAEKAEAERARQARVADQEARRRRNLELDGIVEGRVLNVDDAELPRYFEHLGRIRRVLCTREQRDAINAGHLGVVGLRGRYLIVEPDVLEAFRALAPDLVPDLSGAEPEAEKGGEYPPVPDDLAW